MHTVINMKDAWQETHEVIERIRSAKTLNGFDKPQEQKETETAKASELRKERIERIENPRRVLALALIGAVVAGAGCAMIREKNE